MNTPENKQGKKNVFVESLKRPNLWLVILVVILTIAFYLLDIQASWDSSVLTLLLNIVFVVIPAFFIAVISSRGFLQSGSWQIMWLGVGTLTYGLAVLLSFWVRTWAPANAQTTTFTVVYLLASLFFFIGSLLALNKDSLKAFSSSRGRLANLLLIYFIVAALISLTTFVSVRELLPPFFIQGEGSTDLRIILQVIALVLFLVSGLLIITNYLKSKTAFLLWYGLGLILTVVNTAGNLVLTSFGTPLNWVLRGAQLLAGIYLLMAAVTIVREAKVRRLPTGEALARLLSTTEAALREKEAALKVSEERYRLAVAATDDAIWDIDLNTGSVYWNETYTAKFGRPPETSSSWQWWIDHIHPEESEQVASSLRAAIDSLDKSWVREYRFQRIDGLWANIYDRAYIARDESGQAWRVVGAMQDITERKKAEEAVLQEKDKAKQLLDIAGVIIIGLDLEGKVTLMNAKGCALTGYKIDEVTGKQFTELLLPPRIREKLSADFNTLKSGDLKTTEYIENPIITKQGEERLIAWHNSVIRDEKGNITGTLSSGEDITDRKKAEESLHRYASDLETANKELETFSYSVSHDLRSPLRTLDGFSEMAILEYGDKLGETGQDYLNRVRKASQTMSRLIDDILKLSRISRAELHREKIVLSDLAKSIVEELKTSQPERQAEFIIHPELTVRGDKNLLEIGLRNLLENAWKYSSKCSHTRIEFGCLNQKGEQIYFVRDNGVGFDMKYSDKLFQPFHRLHNDKDYPGTGIGLATVQRIIHRHNGRIWAESEVGKGSTFYFTLG